MGEKISICWLRRDLRLNDHAALYYALKSNYPILPVFIFDTDILNKLSDKKDKRVAFIHQSLEKLNAILKENGSSLYVLHDTAQAAFEKICRQFEVKEVFANHDYEPYAMDRDAKIKDFLSLKNIPFHTYKDQVIFERSEVMKADGTPYTVYTPYSNKWKQKYAGEKPHSFSSKNHLSNLIKIEPIHFPSLEDIGFEKVEVELPELNIGEESIRRYQETRNLPSIKGTSQVSVHLRFGTISVRHLVKLASQWNEQWLNELIWREFFTMILFHFPHVVKHSFKKKYDLIPWRNNEKEFQQW